MLRGGITRPAKAEWSRALNFVHAVLQQISQRYEFVFGRGNDKKLFRKFDSSNIIRNFSAPSMLTLPSMYQFDQMYVCICMYNYMHITYGVTYFFIHWLLKGYPTYLKPCFYF